MTVFSPKALFVTGADSSGPTEVPPVSGSVLSLQLGPPPPPGSTEGGAGPADCLLPEPGQHAALELQLDLLRLQEAQLRRRDTLTKTRCFFIRGGILGDVSQPSGRAVADWRVYPRVLTRAEMAASRVPGS